MDRVLKKLLIINFSNNDNDVGSRITLSSNHHWPIYLLVAWKFGLLNLLLLSGITRCQKLCWVFVVRVLLQSALNFHLLILPQMSGQVYQVQSPPAYQLGVPIACQSSDKMDFHLTRAPRLCRMENRQTFSAPPLPLLSISLLVFLQLLLSWFFILCIAAMLLRSAGCESTPMVNDNSLKRQLLN